MSKVMMRYVNEVTCDGCHITEQREHIPRNGVMEYPDDWTRLYAQHERRVDFAYATSDSKDLCPKCYTRLLETFRWRSISSTRHI